GGVMGFAYGMGIPFDAVLWVGGVLTILGVPYVTLWWKQADEGVREAHKWAWFWGGGSGLLGGIVLGVVNARLDLGWLEPLLTSFAGTPLTGFESGMLFLMLV